MQIDEFRSEILEVLSYMLTSARGLIDEPWRYGPFRLIEAAGRLADIMQRAGLEDEIWSQVAARIQGRDTRMGDDEVALARFLDDLILLCVAELKQA
jgi:hypothetical protein